MLQRNVYWSAPVCIICKSRGLQGEKGQGKPEARSKGLEEERLWALFPLSQPPFFLSIHNSSRPPLPSSIDFQYIPHHIFPNGSVVRSLPAMQETWVWSLGQEDPLEEAMATHSSILAWKFPWTEEPGGLQESDTTEHRAHVPHHDLALKNKVGH